MPQECPQEIRTKKLMFMLFFPSLMSTSLLTGCGQRPKNPQNEQDVHGFQVRTPIFQMVHISRAYPPSPSPNKDPPPFMGMSGLEKGSLRKVILFITLQRCHRFVSNARIFSLEESLATLKSLRSLESQENSRILLCLPQSGGSLESLKSLESLESGLF